MPSRGEVYSIKETVELVKGKPKFAVNAGDLVVFHKLCGESSKSAQKSLAPPDWWKVRVKGSSSAKNDRFVDPLNCQLVSAAPIATAAADIQHQRSPSSTSSIGSVGEVRNAPVLLQAAVGKLKYS